MLSEIRANFESSPEYSDVTDKLMLPVPSWACDKARSQSHVLDKG